MGSFKESRERREKGMGGREREAENYSWLNVSLKQRTRLLFVKDPDRQACLWEWFREGRRWAPGHGPVRADLSANSHGSWERRRWRGGCKGRNGCDEDKEPNEKQRAGWGLQLPGHSPRVLPGVTPPAQPSPAQHTGVGPAGSTLPTLTQ